MAEDLDESVEAKSEDNGGEESNERNEVSGADAEPEPVTMNAVDAGDDGDGDVLDRIAAKLVEWDREADRQSEGVERIEQDRSFY